LLLQRLRTHELKELFFKHEMLLVDVHTIMGVAGAVAGAEIRLVEWLEGKDLNDSVMITTPGGISRVPIQPDAYLTIEDSRRPDGVNRIRFFLRGRPLNRNTVSFYREDHRILAVLRAGLACKEI
jgi:hypothetical protein